MQVLSNMVNMEQIISNSRGGLKYASWVWSHSETCGDAIAQTESSLWVELCQERLCKARPAASARWHLGCPCLLEHPVRVHPRLGVFAHQVFPSDSEQHFSMSFDLKSWTGFLRHRADLWFLWVLAQGRWWWRQLGRLRPALTLWVKPQPAPVTAPITLRALWSPQTTKTNTYLRGGSGRCCLMQRRPPTQAELSVVSGAWTCCHIAAQGPGAVGNTWALFSSHSFVGAQVILPPRTLQSLLSTLGHSGHSGHSGSASVWLHREPRLARQGQSFVRPLGARSLQRHPGLRTAEA